MHITLDDEIKSLSVGPKATIADVIARIQGSGAFACCLYFDGDRGFVNIFTDGDVRRAILAGCELNAAASEIERIKATTARPRAIVAPLSSTDFEREGLFVEHSLRQLLLVDEHGSPKAIIDRGSINLAPPSGNQTQFTAVIVAGGFGTRLKPLTDTIPKPMLPINGRPMLEIIVEKLVSHGANQIYITTHYLSEQIVEHFGDGSRFGAPISFIHEETPLGTGGALSVLPSKRQSTLVFNGDILTDLNISMFLGHHRQSRSAMSIAASQFRYQVPFGVLSGTDTQVTRIEEKPSFSFLVNCGIYFLDRSVFGILPASGAYNMTDVAGWLIERQMPVTCFPIFERWLDVGRPSDFAEAAEHF